MVAATTAAGLGSYVAIRPSQPWLLWFSAVLVAVAVDGTVRANPQWDGERPGDTLVYLLLPVLTLLGSGFFIDHALGGYARPLSAAAAGLVIGAIAYGEYETVNLESRFYGPVRLGLAIVTYLTAFALYAVIFSLDIDLPIAAALVACVSFALSIELLRESRLLGPSSVLVGAAIALSLGELRLALYFFPLDGLLAGALLIIGFYLATGIVHHLLDHDFEWSTTAEYLLVTGVGTAAVVVTRIYV